MQNVVLVGVVMMTCHYTERHYADCHGAVLLTFQLVSVVSIATMVYFMTYKDAIISSNCSYLGPHSQCFISFVTHEWA
jgi:hypothetical protein